MSVIVATFNRKKLLENCLNSLFKMDYPSSRFEVIVVDNCSTDGTREMVCKRFSKAKYIFEKRKGVVYARNTGWKHAKGAFVAYTDDDCIVDQFWLRSLANGFTSTEIGGVGGPVLLLRPEMIPQKFWKTPIGPFYLGNRKHFVEALITANLAISREVFEKVRFDASLLTYHLPDYEDIELCRSLTEAGYKILYTPDAKVYHNIDPKRANIRYLLRRAFFSGINRYIMERKRNAKGILMLKFLRALLGGFFDFFRGRKSANFFWLAVCFVSFLSSIVLFALPAQEKT